MPTIKVDISVCGWWEDASSKEERHFRQPPTPKSWVELHADQEYTLMVRLERFNRSRDLKAHCPSFPRGKDEGWFLSLGNVENGELLALKRVPAWRSSRNSQQLTFYTPNKTGENIKCYTGAGSF